MIILYITYPMRDMKKRKGCIASYLKGEKLPQNILKSFLPTGSCGWCPARNGLQLRTNAGVAAERARGRLSYLWPHKVRLFW